MPTRPPKKWFHRAVASVKRSGLPPGSSAEAVVGQTWYHRMSPEAKRKAMRMEGDSFLGGRRLPGGADRFGKHHGSDKQRIAAAMRRKWHEYNRENTEFSTWAERDRANVELRDKITGDSIIDAWDEAVNEMISDGYLTEPHGVMGMRTPNIENQWWDDCIEYANTMELIPMPSEWWQQSRRAAEQEEARQRQAEEAMGEEIILYSPDMKISNLDALPAGKGARFLECVSAHRPELPPIAKAWHHTVPPKFDILIDFQAYDRSPRGAATRAEVKRISRGWRSEEAQLFGDPGKREPKNVILNVTRGSGFSEYNRLRSLGWRTAWSGEGKICMVERSPKEAKQFARPMEVIRGTIRFKKRGGRITFDTLADRDEFRKSGYQPYATMWNQDAWARMIDDPKFTALFPSHELLDYDKMNR